MTYLRESAFTVDQPSDAIAAAAEAHGFGVLHPYDFQQILAKKGVPIAARCRVFEICNPCPASVVLALVSNDDEVANSAREVETAMKAMIGTLAIGGVGSAD